MDDNFSHNINYSNGFIPNVANRMKYPINNYGYTKPYGPYNTYNSYNSYNQEPENSFFNREHFTTKRKKNYNNKNTDHIIILLLFLVLALIIIQSAIMISSFNNIKHKLELIEMKTK